MTYHVCVLRNLNIAQCGLKKGNDVNCNNKEMYMEKNLTDQEAMNMGKQYQLA